ncbi:hypothetical protein TPENAI_50118 [Tenacibaculum litopenaei]|uniref:hypothetical protein n=1 Tax=Tenacibaculum litopenaei TaxID=396016 RepID=UPI00389481A6
MNNILTYLIRGLLIVGIMLCIDRIIDLLKSDKKQNQWQQLSSKGIRILLLLIILISLLYLLFVSYTS